MISNELFVYINSGEDSPDYTEILYCSKTDKSQLNEVIEIVKSCCLNTTYLGKIFLLEMQEFGGPDLNPFEIKSDSIDIHKQYNEDLIEIDSIIQNRLNSENDKGLVLLHGKAGNGKTSYIRYLTSKVNKRMIFLTPELMHKISSPEFLSILSNYPNSVIIIEDAETIIEERKGGGGSAVSNLLNLTDGLLSDCLKIQLICTFNTDVSKIDKALLRKGRLIARYEFKELEQSKAQKLSNSLGFSSKIKDSMSISEIFNQSDKRFEQIVEKTIGFDFTN
jgi:hypothetical protein